MFDQEVDERFTFFFGKLQKSVVQFGVLEPQILQSIESVLSKHRE